MKRLLIALALAALAVIAAAPFNLAVRAADSGPSEATTIQSLAEPTQGLAVLQRSPGSGFAAFAAAKGDGILLPGDEADSPFNRASTFVDLYGHAFGLQSRADVRLQRAPRRDALGFDHVKFQQMHMGVPVVGGELIVHLRGRRATGANGRVLDELPRDVRPSVLPEDAVGAARQVIARHEPNRAAGARYSTPRLEIVSRAFLEHRTGGQASLAWFIEATGPSLRQFIWIDARTGGLVLQFSQLTTALNRQVYDAGFGPPPGTLVRAEGGPPTGIQEIDTVYDLSGVAYDYFFTTFGRDSYDGLGSPLVSVVNADPSGLALSDGFMCALWTGSQVVYCDSSILTDDIVGHEITHAVIEKEANLYFFGQSGALNDSFADIFGETIDQLAPFFGNDLPFDHWQIGEDSMFGALRNMMFGFPGKMSDVNICETLQDAGGVHVNSGVPNHAFALMVDGGTYNSFTITGIGLDKAARIEYRALTTYLTTSSNFLDNFNALNQACLDLVGTAGITTVDCSEVEKALRAVEMNGSSQCTDSFMNDVPSMCPAGGSPNYLFNNDFEAPVTQWTTSSTTATQWVAQGFNVDEGAQAMVGSNPVGNHDHRIAMNANIGGAPLPAGTRAIFRHLAEFDGGFDGAGVEYSTNGGTSWINAHPLIDGGLRPDVTIADGSSPFLNRLIFSRPSYGYRTSRLTLASLAGQSVRLRFRVASGTGIGPDFPTSGWFLDRVAVYTCPVVAGAPTITVQPASQLVGAGATANFAVTASSNPASTLRYQWLKNGSPIAGATANTLAVTNAQVSSQGYYSVIVTNDAGTATSDGAPLRINIIAFTGPRFTTQPLSRTITAGQSVQFVADAFPSNGGFTAIEWQFSTTGAGGPWSSIPNAPPYSAVGLTLDVVNVPIDLNGTWYRLSLTDNSGTSVSRPVVLNVLPVNLMTNGAFGSGDTTGWQYFDNPVGTGQQQVTGGVFEWNRPASADTSVIFQVTNRAVSGTPLAAQFDLGNSANIRQRISVLMIDSDFSDITVCTFWLEPGAPMRTYRMRTHTTKPWANAAIYFYSATTASFAVNGGYLRLDNVSFNFNDSGSELRTECLDPTAPAPGVGGDSATLLTNGDFSAGATGWGTFGVITSQVSNGVFEYMRPSPAPAIPAGVVFQATGVAVNAGQALTATMDLGNTSSTKTRVTALVLAGDFSDLAACTFYLPAGLPLSTYQMKMRATKAWSAGAATGAALYVYAATIGSNRWTQLDNARLQFTPSATILGTECIEPAEVLTPGAGAALSDSAPSLGVPDPAPASYVVTPARPVRSDGAIGQPHFRNANVDEWLPLAGDDGSQVLRWNRAIDLADVAESRLRFLSSSAGVHGGVGEVQVSAEGLPWRTVATIAPDETWTAVEVDLSEYAGHTIYIQFVHRPANGRSEVLRIMAVRVTRWKP